MNGVTISSLSPV